MPSEPSGEAHILIPESLAREIPLLYATQHESDPLARVKLFPPDSSWTWLVTEYDAVERLCFGLVIGHDRELGYFSVAELEEVRGPLGLRIERNLFFKPTALSKCR